MQGKLKRIKELSLRIPIHSLFLAPNRANNDIGLVIHVDQITNGGWNVKGKEKNRTENIQVKMGWNVVGRIWKLENSGSGIRLPEFPTQSYCFLTKWPSAGWFTSAGLGVLIYKTAIIRVPISQGYGEHVKCLGEGLVHTRCFPVLAVIVSGNKSSQ